MAEYARIIRQDRSREVMDLGMGLSLWLQRLVTDERFDLVFVLIILIRVGVFLNVFYTSC